MWKFLSKAFDGLPGQWMVARKMTELGLCVREDGSIACADAVVTDVSLGAACKVDRRVVRATVQTIQKSAELTRVFGNNRPAGSLLVGAAKEFGFGVVELEADAHTPGIIAKATTLLAEKRINVRQIYGKDPDLYEKPTLTIVTEKPIPGAIIPLFSKIKGVSKVSVL